MARVYFHIDLNAFFANAVDLALPSGVKWSNVNLGATNELRPGALYQWGDTQPYRKGEVEYWDNYKYSAGEKNSLIKYCRDTRCGYNNYTDSLDVLEIMDDAASQLLGERWRIPTKLDWDELLNPSNCEWSLLFNNEPGGKKAIGYKVTSRRNGNSITLPFEWFGTASYLSSSLGYSSSEWYYAVTISETIQLHEIVRFSSALIRPVYHE